MDTPSQIKERFVTQHAKLSSKLKWGIGLAVCLIVLPLAWTIAYFMAGAVVALVLGVVLFAAIQMLPVMANAIANYKLAALKREAERNPVETLQIQQLQLENDLAVAANKITNFDAEVESFRNSLSNELASGFIDAVQQGLPTLHRMEQLLVFRRRKWKESQAKLVARAQRVRLAESKWRVAMASQKVTQASGELELKGFERILEEVAFRSVDHELGTAIAEMNTAIMVEELPESEVVEVVEVRQLEDKTAMTKQLQALLRSPQHEELAINTIH